MNTVSPCYKFSRSVVGEHVPLDSLRLELSPTRFCFLSYHHLDIAIFESATDRDTLTISFLNHQVRIAGTNLRELAVAIQSRSVESIKPMPGRYSGAKAAEAGFVESIEVEASGGQI
jgi:hypothetical protein